MADHTVTVAKSSGGALAFSDNFNVAVPFIDRHLAEGRAEKVAIPLMVPSTGHMSAHTRIMVRPAPAWSTVPFAAS